MLDYVIYFFITLFATSICSLTGMGSGPINVTVIVFLFSLPIKTATICSLLTILFSQFSKLATVFFTNGFSDLDFTVVAVMVIAAIIGGFLGAHFSKKLSENTVQKALAEIENQKLIYTERTNGKFVTENEELIENVKKELANQKVQKYFQDMNKLGINKQDAITYLQGK